MKQYTNAKHWAMLTKKQVSALRKKTILWEMKFDRDGIPMFPIGQIIEYLDDMQLEITKLRESDKWHITTKLTGEIEKELIDALWLAVIEKLKQA